MRCSSESGMQGVLSDDYFKARTTLLSCLWKNRAAFEREMEASSKGDVLFEGLYAVDQRKILSGMHDSILRCAQEDRQIAERPKWADGMHGLERLGGRCYWPKSDAYKAIQDAAKEIDEPSVRAGVSGDAPLRSPSSAAQVSQEATTVSGASEAVVMTCGGDIPVPTHSAAPASDSGASGSTHLNQRQADPQAHWMRGVTYATIVSRDRLLKMSKSLLLQANQSIVGVHSLNASKTEFSVSLALVQGHLIRVATRLCRQMAFRVCPWPMYCKYTSACYLCRSSGIMSTPAGRTMWDTRHVSSCSR